MTNATFSVPAEWAQQRAIWIGWPSDHENWPGPHLEGARIEISDLAALVAKQVDVHLVAGNVAAAEVAQKMCGDVARVHNLPMGDIWLRDIGPVFARSDTGLVGLTFDFNGWGGRYIMEGDTRTADAILAITDTPSRRHEFILEGGSVDHNGQGALLTTRQCLLNPNRNPGWRDVEATANLKSAFGASEVIWLDEGLAGDHTDGHVDNLARFVGPEHVVCQSPSGTDDPNAAVLEKVKNDLVAAGLNVTEIPSAGHVLDDDGKLAAASHMNFIFANQLVVLPIYDAARGEAARLALAQALPQHDVVALPSNHILSGGGSFHCISQQVPDIVSDTERQT